MFHLSGYWKTDDLFTIAAGKKHTTSPIFTLAIFTLTNQLDMSKMTTVCVFELVTKDHCHDKLDYLSLTNENADLLPLLFNIDEELAYLLIY